MLEVEVEFLGTLGGGDPKGEEEQGEVKGWIKTGETLFNN